MTNLLTQAHEATETAEKALQFATQFAAESASRWNEALSAQYHATRGELFAELASGPATRLANESRRLLVRARRILDECASAQAAAHHD